MCGCGRRATVITRHEVELLFLHRFVSSFRFLHIKYVAMGRGGVIWQTITPLALFDYMNIDVNDNDTMKNQIFNIADIFLCTIPSLG